MLYVFRTHLLVKQATNPSFHTTTARPRSGFSQPVLSHEIFPIFSPFSQSLWLAAQSSTVLTPYSHSQSKGFKLSFREICQRKGNNNKPFSAPPTARAGFHSLLCPDTSLLLCLHTGAHRSSDTSTKEPQARGWTNHKVQQSRKDANYLLPNNAWPGRADFVEKREQRSKLAGKWVGLFWWKLYGLLRCGNDFTPITQLHKKTK